jgi:hypothetical protein
MHEYVVDLRQAVDFEGFVAAFNAGVCARHGETWQGRSWDAFEDLLYSALGAEGDAATQRVRIRFVGWARCPGLATVTRDRVARILAAIPQIETLYD